MLCVCGVKQQQNPNYGTQPPEFMIDFFLNSAAILCFFPSFYFSELDSVCKNYVTRL